MWLQLRREDFLAIDLTGAIIRTSPRQTKTSDDELVLELLSEPKNGCWVQFILAGGKCRIHFSTRERLDSFITALSDALATNQRLIDAQSYDPDARVEVSTALESAAGGLPPRPKSSQVSPSVKRESPSSTDIGSGSSYPSTRRTDHSSDDRSSGQDGGGLLFPGGLNDESDD
ncbi:MAG: hypothetical protein ACFCD0_23650 [Gemmataceae bacterium]